MMITESMLKKLLPRAVKWIADQEKYILQHGAKLSEDQQIDAFLIGIAEPNAIRILETNEVPIPQDLELSAAANEIGLISKNTVGMSFRQGIWMKPSTNNKRKLLAHELTHTVQYRRLGGIQNFLTQYLKECIEIGYPFGSLEREARAMEEKISAS
ncbi:MAG: DUF4157 domain-containing protein [Bacteroidota bacterium]